MAGLSSHRRLQGSHSTALGISVFLHGLLVTSIFSTPKAKIEERWNGHFARGAEDQPSSPWVLIDAVADGAPFSSEGGDATSAFLADLSAPQFSLDPPTLPSEALFDADSSGPQPPVTTTVDQSGYLAMYGRYTSQASARVERAWVRPRIPLAAGQFFCTVRIEQSPNGEVRSTELIDCNGDSQWQESLVFAIERASPLPPPPDPAVFTAQLILTFSAAPYVQGISRDEEYAPLRPRVANNP